MADDSYHTIARASSVEIKVKASRFIGESFLITSTAEAIERWHAVRRREHAATHHCYAYVTGLATDTQFKYSDDGEPSGTAGKPIYDVICGHDVTNTLVVVTRYFGGTKLGTGGLVRAYGDAAQQCLQTSGRREHFLTDSLRITIEFPLYDRLVRLMQRYEAKAIETDYSDVVDCLLTIRQSRTDKFRNELIGLSGGKAIIDTIETTG
jgi:uncharacterized YigZ family protein